MPKVLTQGSTLTCAHKGTIQLTAGQSVLKVDGQAVLVEGDLSGATISGCTTPNSSPPAPLTKQCTKVIAMSVGAAVKLKAGGKAVLLETATGTTDGISPTGNLWNVQSAGQTKLDVT